MLQVRTKNNYNTKKLLKNALATTSFLLVLTYFCARTNILRIKKKSRCWY